MKADNQGITVLLVEDEPALREALGRELQRNGYDVLTAEHGNAALVVHAQNEVDVIVTDIFMPEKDGLELILELRRMGAATKIIAMTGSNTNQNYLTHAELFGACKTLFKPFRLEELTRSINAAVALDTTSTHASDSDPSVPS